MGKTAKFRSIGHMRGAPGLDQGSTRGVIGHIRREVFGKYSGSKGEEWGSIDGRREE